MEKEMEKMERICGLWLNKSKAGKKYLSGSWLNIRVLVLPNINKKDTQPDYYLCLAEKKQPKSEILDEKEPEIEDLG